MQHNLTPFCTVSSMFIKVHSLTVQKMKLKLQTLILFYPSAKHQLMTFTATKLRRKL